MESFADLFPLVLDHCKGKISDVAFNLWLKDIVPVPVSYTHLTLPTKA